MNKTTAAAYPPRKICLRLLKCSGSEAWLSMELIMLVYCNDCFTFHFTKDDAQLLDKTLLHSTTEWTQNRLSICVRKKVYDQIDKLQMRPFYSLVQHHLLLQAIKSNILPSSVMIRNLWEASDHLETHHLSMVYSVYYFQTRSPLNLIKEKTNNAKWVASLMIP